MKKEIADMTPEEINQEVLNRPDLQADIVQAAVDVAKVQSFTPDSVESQAAWMEANKGAIHARFKEIQEERLAKYLKHRDQINRVISAQVWSEIRRRNIA